MGVAAKRWVVETRKRRVLAGTSLDGGAIGFVATRGVRARRKWPVGQLARWASGQTTAAWFCYPNKFLNIQMIQTCKI
jgi:hypothetical protein